MEAFVTWEHALSWGQVLVLPAIIWLGRVLTKLGERIDKITDRVDAIERDHNARVAAVEKDQIRANAFFETWRVQRNEDRLAINELFKEIKDALVKVNERLDRMETRRSDDFR